ncbi:MAG: gliding motility protein GldL [Paludibacteraceae bacterium]|nr:gliding motility protein GldL [Paludibacteraceae bacterium]
MAKEKNAMKKEKMSFLDWWNSSDTVKLWVGRVYSVGAAIVIIGALFKIMHFPGAGVMLCIGMGTEAILFMIGCLDKPHEVYHWDKVFPQFRKNAEQSADVSGTMPTMSATPQVLSDEDAKKLSDGVQSVAKTAEKLASLSDVVGSVDALKKSMDTASVETDKFIQSQSLLNTSSEKLASSYNGISGDMEKVVAQTKDYLTRVEVVNKNLEAINGVYELQLNELRGQLEVVSSQNEGMKNMTSSIDNVNSNVNQLKTLLDSILIEEQNFNKGVQDLNTKVSNLNSIYGNMLNALS